MKLLMITGDRTLAQGKQGAFWNTMSGFHKHWERVDIITPRIPVHRYDMVLFGNVHVHPSPFPLFLQPLWIWWRGRQLVGEEGHDLMTAHSYPPFYNDMGAWLLSRTARIPYVLEVMHVPGLPRASNFKEWSYRLLVRLFVRCFARRARAVRVINQHETPDFLVRSGVPRGKLAYLPAFYVDLETFRPYEVGPRKSYDLVFVGRLSANKGLKRFMEVARLADCRALIVGDGPLRQWAQEYAKARRVSAVFHGFARDHHEVAALINSARLLVMVSDNEGGPRVVLEAMACGVPVLATPVGIVPDVLPPEAIEGWDNRALADKVRNILSDRQLYDRLRESGLLAATRFEKSIAIAEYADGLKRLTA